jgi:hypothetical protein
MMYLLLTITPFLAVWGVIVVIVVMFLGCAVLWQLATWDNKPSDSKKATETKTLGYKFPRIPKIQFTDSNWVVLYKFCGWVGIIIAIIVIFQEQYMTAVYFVCMGLSAFLAAHILRLLEKGVHHLENLDKRGEQQTKE